MRFQVFSFYWMGLGITILQIGLTRSQCNNEELLENVVVSNLRETVNFNLPNKSALSNYSMEITYFWDVQIPEGSHLDGFIYCFVSSDSENDFSPPLFGWDAGSLLQADDSGQGLLHDFFFGNEFASGLSQNAYESCLHYENQTFWVTDKNGNYTKCPYPCQDHLDQDCIGSFPPVCSHLASSDCGALRKEHRNITLPVKFGRKYDFSVLPYSGQETNDEQKTSTTSYALFCAHHLVENISLPQESAYEFCRSEQTIGRHTASGPPARLGVRDIFRNYEENTVTLIIQWRAPHDIRNGSNITIFYLYVNEDHLENGKVVAKTPEEEREDPYYTKNLTFTGIDRDRRLFIEVTPSAVTQKTCPIRCTAQGEVARLEVEVEEYFPCNSTRNDTRYCDAEAECLPSKGRGRILANCTCPAGFKGNGVNPLLVSTGSGCQNFNACVDGVERFCSQHAFCVDAPPPSSTVLSCTCRSGYLGDGWLSGSGCTHIALVIVLSIITFILLLGALVIVVRLRCRLKNKRLLEATLSRFVPGRSGTYIGPLTGLFSLTNDEPMVPQPVFGAKNELERSAILKHEIIGRGNFGVVHKATLDTQDGPKTVAVKSLTDAHTANYRNEFLAEISLLIHLGKHENILSLEGVCTIPSLESDEEGGESPLLVMEYMLYGDLLHFLWNSRDPEVREKEPIYNFTEVSLYKVGRQVADGMHFLSQCRIIHGDVAARNILVGENLKAKISDFGLANDVYRYGVIKGATERRVPFKWICPERMMGGKTPVTWKSDVWSFGILLYEMVTLGAAPYPAMDPVTIFYKLQEGYRIPQPLSCSDYLYKIMMSCWEWHSYNRPTFKRLAELLQDTVFSTSDHPDPSIDIPQEIDKTNYEKDIGRRDSNSFLPTDTNDPDESYPENVSSDSQTHLNEAVQDDSAKSVDEMQKLHWKPWSGDICVTVPDDTNSLTEHNDDLV